jgi:catechol 2,3-dioxygenase-like lactoylglutathione lyase family enzyme
MIGYTTVGANDFERAARYYDKLLGEIGAKRTMQSDRFIVWSSSPSRPGFSLVKPFDGKPATVGNGSMVAFAVQEPSQVDRLHALALELGGTDEGAPGPRGGGFYAGYFRDPEGNKLNFFCVVQAN